MKKIIKLIVEIESDEDLNLDELAVGKYVEDTTTDSKMLLMSEGNIGEDSFFRVTEYHKVEDVTDKIRLQRQQLIALQVVNNRFVSDTDYEEEYQKLDTDEQKDVDAQKYNDI